MKNIIFSLIFLISSSLVHADCRPQIEAELIKRVTTQKKVARAGKISTGATFVTFGGFWGYMGVYMLGPLWAGAVIGATFGSVAAAPVGATFIIIDQVQKKKIRNLGKTLSIINSGDELLKLHEKLPHISLEVLKFQIAKLNESKALCDGTVAQYDRPLRRKLVASPKDIVRYFESDYSIVVH
jgi:uncharacterized membrane protein